MYILLLKLNFIILYNFYFLKIILIKNKFVYLYFELLSRNIKKIIKLNNNNS